MATFNLNAGDVGAYEKTLVAATVDTVNFQEAVDRVEIYSSGADEIYFTLDGAAPTVGGATTLLLPAAASVRTIRVPKRDSPTVVKLISAGTPVYSVAKEVK